MGITAAFFHSRGTCWRFSDLLNRVVRGTTIPGPAFVGNWYANPSDPDDLLAGRDRRALLTSDAQMLSRVRTPQRVWKVWKKYGICFFNLQTWKRYGTLWKALEISKKGLELLSFPEKKFWRLKVCFPLKRSEAAAASLTESSLSAVPSFHVWSYSWYKLRKAGPQLLARAPLQKIIIKGTLRTMASIHHYFARKQVGDTQKRGKPEMRSSCRNSLDLQSCRRELGPAAGLQVSPTSDTSVGQSVAILTNRRHSFVEKRSFASQAVDPGFWLTVFANEESSNFSLFLWDCLKGTTSSRFPCFAFFRHRVLHSKDWCVIGKKIHITVGESSNIIHVQRKQKRAQDRILWNTGM